MRSYDKISTRDAFGQALYEIMLHDDSVFSIGADTTKNMGMGRIEKEIPDRCYNVGICEQNAALIAAGIASCGAEVYVGTYSPFASMRMLEQVRTFCAYTNLNVKVVSGMSGLTGGPEGVTHQGSEDLSLLRCIPNMVVVTAADANATKAITREIHKHKGPAYIRLGRTPAHTVFGEDYHFEIGKANVIHSGGKDITLIFAGQSAHKVIDAYHELVEKGYTCDLIEMPCVKPIDKEAILFSAKNTRAVITVEDNNINGGLGSAVAEVLGENLPTIMKRIGLNDCFAESGEEDQLMDKYGISIENIVNTSVSLMALKV